MSADHAPEGIDVVVIGEVLVELSSEGVFRCGGDLRLGVSGDALNAAAAAAAAGARTALLTRVADDELGEVIAARVAELGVSTALVRRVPGQQGVYFLSVDPGGEREFVYVRRGSAGSTLEPSDVDAVGLDSVGAVLATGVTAAISSSARAAVLRAAGAARRFVYDPNFRARLTTPAEAARALAELVPYAELVTPACARETQAFFGTDDPVAAAKACRDLGARAVAVTCGAEGVVLDGGNGQGPVHLPAVPPSALVDQTGAGDVFAGTVTARRALGDTLRDAVGYGMAAASLSLAGRGGTGHIPTFADTRRAAGSARRA
ncbi:MAG: PfkB family carbohydrate kinase [Streptosporangiaceae bacterium]